MLDYDFRFAMPPLLFSLLLMLMPMLSRRFHYASLFAHADAAVSLIYLRLLYMPYYMLITIIFFHAIRYATYAMICCCYMLHMFY